MRTNHDLVDVDLCFRLFPKSGLSAAFSEDEEIHFPPKRLIILPLSQIEIHPKNPREDQVVRVTMPEWLAIDKELV